MFIQLNKNNAQKVKETVYCAKSGISAEAANDDDSQAATAPDHHELLMQLAENNFLEVRKGENTDTLDVVQLVGDAIAHSLPQLDAKQMQHAVFVKQMFYEGEITLHDYLIKMRNLFPERMDNLSADLQALVQELNTSHSN